MYDDQPYQYYASVESPYDDEPEWNDLCARAPDHRYNQTFSWLWRVWECVLSKKNYDLQL